ncbi:hypothetical protein B481_0270 [Planococcus halocryophilus Or1]|nr:hypothetical protein [Planococcus halocryophilus]EMF48149.1 hypothetical protein B481_0270 [Planococcus halocryophilus Or1]
MTNQEGVLIRPYQDEDFPTINELNKQQGWNNLVEKNKRQNRLGPTLQ